MATYLITGGCGFIGSHLAERLVRYGHKVKILDDLSTGKKENLPPGCELIVGSITEKGDLIKALMGAHGCFHLAAIASVEASVKEWSKAHLVNLYGTILLFETIAKSGRAIPVVYASSAAVYGNPMAIPLKETSSLAPVSPYGADKLGCEQHARLAWQLFHIPSTGFRIFNVYGKRQESSSPYSGVVAKFIEKISKNKTISIFGDGEQKRDFLYVDDVISFLLAAMDKTTKGAHIFNLCTGKAISINELAHLIAKILHVELKIKYLPAREGDLRISIGDTKALESYFRSAPSIDLEQGLSLLMQEMVLPVTMTVS